MQEKKILNNQSFNEERALVIAKNVEIFCIERERLYVDISDVTLLDDELIRSTDEWKKFYQVCSQRQFLSMIEEGALESLKASNFLTYYLEENQGGEHPLTLAAQYRRWDVLKWLVEKGSDIDLAEGAWDLVFCTGEVALAKYLVEDSCIDFNKKTSRGNFPLFLAIRNPQAEMLIWLLKEEQANIQVVNDIGRSLLHEVIDQESKKREENSLYYVDLLVQHGIDIDTVDNAQESALIRASNKGRKDIVVYLLKQGAIICPYTEYLPALLESISDLFLCLIKDGDLQALKSLNCFDYYNAFYYKAYKAYKVFQDNLPFYLRNDFSINPYKHPIVMAIEHSQGEILNWLLAEKTSEYELEALWKPIFFEGDVEKAKQLMQYAPVNIKQNSFPLYLAVCNCQEEMLDWLLKEQKADIQIINEMGSLLHRLIYQYSHDDQEGCLKRMRLLVERGINIDALDITRVSPLFAAYSREMSDVVAYLINLGARIYADSWLSLDDGEDKLFGLLNDLKVVTLELGEDSFLHKFIDDYITIDTSPTDLNLHLKFDWTEDQKDLFLNAIKNNTTLLNFSVTVEGRDETAPFVLYIKRNQINYQNSIFEPYHHYLDEIDLAFRRSITLERIGNGEISTFLAEQIQWIILSPQYEVMSKEERDSYKKASYEWVIYLLSGAAEVAEEYKDNLLKLAFTYLLDKRNGFFSDDELDILIQNKELWVWKEFLFTSIYIFFQEMFPSRIPEIPEDLMIDRDSYQKFLDEVADILKKNVQNDAFNEQLKEAFPYYDFYELVPSYKDKFPKDQPFFVTLQHFIEALKTLSDIGFKPLDRRKKRENADIVFNDFLQAHRRSEYRRKISHEAFSEGFLCFGTHVLMEDPVSVRDEAEFFEGESTTNHRFFERVWIESKLPEGMNSEDLLISETELKNKITAFQKIHHFVSLRKFLLVFKRDGWKALNNLNYMHHYLTCTDHEGNTPMHMAANQGDSDLIHFLQKQACDLKAENLAGLTPLHFALRAGHEVLFFHLLDNRERWAEAYTNSLFFCALEGGCMDALLWIVENFGLSLDSRDMWNSALYIALDKKHEEVAQWLIENWSTAIQDEIETHVLLKAVQAGFPASVSLLIERGYSFDIETEEGLTPLILALDDIHQRQHREVIAQLIESGCNLEAQNKAGLTVLQYIKNYCQMFQDPIFWHLPIIHGARHEPLRERDLMIILHTVSTARLLIVDVEEFKIFAQLLKENSLPDLTSLELRLDGDAFNPKVLLEVLKDNRSLEQFTLFLNGQDYSELFKKFTDRNRWIARFKPYEAYMPLLGIFSFEYEVLADKAVLSQPVGKIIIEFLYHIIFQLPVDQFSEQDGLLFYEWMGRLLEKECFAEPLFRALYEEILSRIPEQSLNDIMTDEEIPSDEVALGLKVLQSESMVKYHACLRLKEVRAEGMGAFKQIGQHLVLNYQPPFFAQPLKDQMAMVSQEDVRAYLVAAILSSTSYWAARNKGKISQEILALQAICKNNAFKDTGCREFLLAIGEEAIRFKTSIPYSNLTEEKFLACLSQLSDADLSVDLQLDRVWMRVCQWRQYQKKEKTAINVLNVRSTTLGRLEAWGEGHHDVLHFNEPLNEEALMEILNKVVQVTRVKLRIAHFKSFEKLAELLIKNQLPTLRRLHLNFIGNDLIEDDLLEVIRINRSLTYFSFSYNGNDYSNKGFKNYTDRNYWIAHFEPYKIYLTRLGILPLEEMLTDEALLERSTIEVIADFLNQVTSQLPLACFDEQDRRSVYQWIYRLLMNKTPDSDTQCYRLIEKAVKEGGRVELQDLTASGHDFDWLALTSHSMTNYYHVVRLTQIRKEGLGEFRAMMQHLVLNYQPDFFNQSMTEQMNAVSPEHVQAYKIGAILSCTHYWKTAGGGKLTEVIQALRTVCKTFKDCSAFLEAIQAEALKQLDENSTRLFPFFAIQQKNPVEQDLLKILSEISERPIDLPKLDKLWEELHRWKLEQQVVKNTEKVNSFFPMF